MINKNNVVCKIDGKVIISNTNRAISIFSRYLKTTYNMTLEEYVLKYYYDNKIPKCACGCGSNVKFFKGRYFKYYSDHKNHIKPSEEVVVLMREKRILKNGFDDRLKRLNLTIDDIKMLYKNFINFDINFTDIEKEYAVDKRTLKKYWSELKLIDNYENFKRVCKKHQYYWGKLKNDKKTKIDEELLFSIYQFLLKNSNKYTLKEIKQLFNMEQTTLVIYKRLVDNFDKSIVDDALKLGISSKPETEYYNVLKYFFGNDINKNFILNNKHYDFILLDSILIEFDGDYWHSIPKNKKNDKIKDMYAKENGYVIVRVRDSESKNIDVLNNIFELYKKKKK